MSATGRRLTQYSAGGGCARVIGEFVGTERPGVVCVARGAR